MNRYPQTITWKLATVPLKPNKTGAFYHQKCEEKVHELQCKVHGWH